MSLRLQTPPASPPITLDQAKLHCRVIADSEDELISALIEAATQDAEHLMGRAVMPQKWQLSLEAFAPSIELHRPTVTAVDSVKYVDEAGVLQTLPSTEYQFVGATDYVARVVPAYGKFWPPARFQPEAVQIVFSCGYESKEAVPELIKAWIKLRVGALYEHRETWTAGLKIEPNEHVDRLLDRYRIWTL